VETGNNIWQDNVSCYNLKNIYLSLEGLKYLSSASFLSNTRYLTRLISLQLFSFSFKENEELSPDLETRTIAKQNVLPSSEGESVTILVIKFEVT